MSSSGSEQTQKGGSHGVENASEYSENSISRLRYWLRQESDHQWLSMGLFIAVVFVVAMLIQQSAITPGLSSSDIIDSDARVIDIAWDEDGTTAILVVDGNEGRSLQKWTVDEKITELVFDSPRTVERFSNGWIVGGDDGVISRCMGPCEVLAPISFDWQGDSSTGLRVIDVSTNDGTSGFILFQSMQSSSVEEDGTVGDRGGEWLSSVRYFEGDILSPASYFESGQHMTEISVTEDGAISAGYGWFGLSSASNMARSVISSISGEVTSSSPEITMRHIGGDGEYHTIIMHDNGSTVVGQSDVVYIDEFDNLSTISGSFGAPAAALDGHGDIWLAGDFGSGSMMKIECGSTTAEMIKVSTIENLEVDVGVTRGGIVEFHGTDDSGSASVQYDPDEANTLYSLDYLIRVVYVFGACSIFAVMLWTVRDKIKNYS